MKTEQMTSLREAIHTALAVWHRTTTAFAAAAGSGGCLETTDQAVTLTDGFHVTQHAVPAEDDPDTYRVTITVSAQDGSRLVDLIGTLEKSMIAPTGTYAENNTILIDPDGLIRCPHCASAQFLSRHTHVVITTPCQLNYTTRTVEMAYDDEDHEGTIDSERYFRCASCGSTVANEDSLFDLVGSDCIFENSSI